MKAVVDADTCTGCGLCVDACPDVFQFNDDGLAEAVCETVLQGKEDACREAAEGCPVEAITIA